MPETLKKKKKASDSFLYSFSKLAFSKKKHDNIYKSTFRFFNFLYYIELYLIYKALVSGEQQNDSVILVSILFQILFLF